MKPKILLQLDTDQQPSSFDAVVAIDSGVEFLLPYGNVNADNVVGLVHGAMFTRGPDDLQHTAIFIGGSSVAQGEQILRKVIKTMFDPLRVSVVLDCNGSNSTASAAVLCAAKHGELKGQRAAIFGASGAVGQRVARLLLAEGVDVVLGSRELSRAQSIAAELHQPDVASSAPRAFDYASSSIEKVLAESDLVFGCGAAGVELITESQLDQASNIRVAIDVNAVPPLGISSIKVTDKAVQRGTRFDYGALGVGGLKMKIHKAAIRRVFEKRGLVIDAAEMLQLGKTV